MKTTKLIEVEGAGLYVTFEPGRDAERVPILFLHANVADQRMWDGLWECLAMRHSLVSYDRRGFGQSRTVKPSPYSNLSDLWAVMNCLELERAVLVGCSMGGTARYRRGIGTPRQSCWSGAGFPRSKWCACAGT